MSPVRIVVALMIAATLAFPAQARVKLSATDGVVVLQMAPQPWARPGVSYSITTSPIRENPSRAGIILGLGLVQFAHKDATQPAYVIRKAKPGTYSIGMLWRGNWGVPLSGAQVYEVRPGEVTFIGRYDGGAALLALEQSIRSGELPNSSINGRIFTLPRSVPLALTPPAGLDEWEVELRNALAAENESLRAAPLRAADLTPLAMPPAPGAS